MNLYSASSWNLQCAVCISTLQTETSLTDSWNCLCRRPGLSSTLAKSSRLMGHPQRKLVRQKNSVGSAVYRLADLRGCRDVTAESGRQKSVWYRGAWPFRQLCTMTLSLYLTRSGTSSQCSSVCTSHNKPLAYYSIPLLDERGKPKSQLCLSHHMLARKVYYSITINNQWRQQDLAHQNWSRLSATGPTWSQCIFNSITTSMKNCSSLYSFKRHLSLIS